MSSRHKTQKVLSKQMHNSNIGQVQETCPLQDFGVFKEQVRALCLHYTHDSKVNSVLNNELFQGKFLRSYLIFCLGGVYAVPRATLVKISTCIEILHEASLVHDDVQDQQKQRRGKDTFWVNNNVNQAINFGDYLLNVSLLPLLDIGENSLDIVREYQILVNVVIKGQIFEQALKGKIPSEKDYFEIIDHKTGALLAAPLNLIGKWIPKKDCSYLRASLFNLARAYQIENDRQDFLLGLDSQDLKNETLTLPFLKIIQDAKTDQAIDHSFWKNHLSRQGIQKVSDEVRAEVKYYFQEFEIQCKLASESLSSNIIERYSSYFNLEKES